jgi:hypothetical protein
MRMENWVPRTADRACRRRGSDVLGMINYAGVVNTVAS